MKRRISNILSALSLLACMATVSLWILSESQYATEPHAYSSGRTWIEAVNMGGRLYFLYMKGFEITDHGKAAEARFTMRLKYRDGYYLRGLDATAFWAVQLGGAFDPRVFDVAPDNLPPYQLKRQFVAFDSGWVRGWMPPIGFSPQALPPKHFWATFDAIAVPHWFLLLLFAATPAWWLWRFLIRRSRRQPGLCPICGYDLRATPDRCPECGTAVPEGHVVKVGP